MAARLVGRLVRLLGPRCPAGASALARPLAAMVTTEPVCVSFWLMHMQTPVRTLCEGHGLAKMEETPAMLVRSELDERVEKATSPQEVLELWCQGNANANQTSVYIAHVVRCAMEERSERKQLLEDPRLQEMLDHVSSQLPQVWNGSLVTLLRSLTQMGVPPGLPLLHSLQTEALWRMRRFSYKQLAYLADWACGRHDAQGEELLGAAVKHLELRWTELAEVRTICLLMARAGHLPPSLLDKLEDKALELAERFSAEDIRRVALALATHGRRSVPLLRALSYHIQQKPSLELKPALLLDVVFTYGKLNFHQTQMLQRIAAELLPQLSQLSPSDVTRCAKSLAYLKWLHQPLFQAFTEHYVKHWQKYNTAQICNLLLAIARLNFHPEKPDEFFTKAHSVLEGALSSLEPYLCTDVVWSLCVLQQARPEYLKAILDPEFQHKLAEGSPSRIVNYRQKLLHIAATAQLEHAWPPEATAVLSLPLTAVSSETPPTSLQSSLHAALHCLTGGLEVCCRTAVVTVFGWTIDGELVLDLNNKPLDLLKLEAPHLPQGGGVKPLPKGSRRIAFIAGEFTHYGSRSKELLGRFAMHRRHLQLTGFLTVEVPYYEWLELKNEWQQVAYLKDKMGKAVAEDMAK